MKDYITVESEGVEYNIPNKWELIREYQWLPLIEDFTSMANGEISPAMVRINYIVRHFDWDVRKIKDPDALANVIMLAEQITFLFLINYPDKDAALSVLDDYTHSLCKRIPPERLQGVAISHYLKRLDYRFSIDLCFCKQFLSSILIDDETLYHGYTIETSYGTLTTSLTALQFIEAKELIGCNEEYLPLLAAILYCPQPYSSEKAHQLASTLAILSKSRLQAISFNFQAFVNYLFSKTHYRILTEGKSGKEKSISTGALDSLYNLSTEGYGDLQSVEKMNALHYLTIIRKKIIDSVRQLYAAKMEITQIEEETGLPLNIIKKII